MSRDFEGDCTGHDLAHLDRVHGIAERLRMSEGGDRTVLAAACYVHDFHRVLEKANGHDPRTDVHDAVDLRIEETLSVIDFSSETIVRVQECVHFTDRYSFSGHVLEAPSMEARILRDADNLDALGATGIARAFMFGGALGEPLWVDDTEPSDTYRAGITSSVVHHFHEKLLRLRDDMLTEAGRALADERHEFMVAFLSQLWSEWESSGLPSGKAQRVPQR